jgi:hypothetical protein
VVAFRFLILFSIDRIFEMSYFYLKVELFYISKTTARLVVVILLFCMVHRWERAFAFG